MSADRSMFLEVELAPLGYGGAGSFCWRHVWREAGVVCDIGTWRRAHICLPRPPFHAIGEVACRLSWIGAELFLDPVGDQVVEVRLDERRFAGGRVNPGSHLLELSGHRFRLTLLVCDADQARST